MEKHNGVGRVGLMNINEMGRRYKRIVLYEHYKNNPLGHEEIKGLTNKYLEIPMYLILNQDTLREITFVMEKEELDDTDYLLLLHGVIMYEADIWDI